MILNLIPVPECDPLTVNGGLEIKLVGDLVTTQLYLYTRDILTIKQKMSDPINPQGQEPSSGPRWLSGPLLLIPVGRSLCTGEMIIVW